MKSTMKVAIILAVVFSFVLVQSAIPAKPVRSVGGDPIWKIFQEGTAQTVEWVDWGPNPRFAIDSAAGDMVLDKETGLVWEREPYQGGADSWGPACVKCYSSATAGDRRGWRLPTVEELSTLVKVGGSGPYIAIGHPFLNAFVHGDVYWTITTHHDGLAGWTVDFSNGQPDYELKSNAFRTWCVRGGNGHAPY